MRHIYVIIQEDIDHGNSSYTYIDNGGMSLTIHVHVIQ